MAEILPIVYTVEHASSDFGDFLKNTNLNAGQRLRFSDYGASETVPQNGFVVLGNYSRALVDLNRAPDAPDLFRREDFAKPKSNKIWKYGRHLLREEQMENISAIYQPYHDEILKSIRSFASKPVLLVSWHNTAHYEIGKDEAGNSQIMKPIILSNRGDENSASSENGITTCDPKLLKLLVKTLEANLGDSSFPHDVYLNFVLKGGYVTEYYNSRTHPELFNTGMPVQSLQVEYDTEITHDQVSLIPNRKNIREFQSVFGESIAVVYKNFFS